ncbi:hypothetical protein P3X46_015461 [Hevea brasiliensis]|uniref:CAAX prenyl protease 2/Lysostaphin resistance protein A-like domain-containing protein n=1 Tax=Hevea brasiliensis TaxID=3981 RepID=A0ABQ9M041_HEVBR|nr:hypothetical protein P3X46_015461 [Hevea brasiliensis]
MCPILKKGLRSVCFFNARGKCKGNFDGQESELDWPILKSWDVPWQWQTASLTSLACGLSSFVLTGLAETAALPILGIRIEELSLDEKAELLLLDQSIATAVVLGVIYSIRNTFQPFPKDMFRYDLREPFNLQKGWLLWAVIGLLGADALVRLLPLIGSSSLYRGTACLVGITVVLDPILEETVFRGFFMVPDKSHFLEFFCRVPTPISVLISAAVFAIGHLIPGEFPQLFVLEMKRNFCACPRIILGFSYAQTCNLLTSITIHAFWNSEVILILTLLQLQGYDIKELLQATQ